MHTCTNCKKQGHSIETCWAKSGGKGGQGLRQKKKSKSKKKKGRAKVNAAKEEYSDGKSGGSITFINFNCATLIKDSSGATVILDTGVSLHMTPHQDMLKNYKNFLKPRTIWAADKGTFNALRTRQLRPKTKVKGKSVNLQLNDTLYAPNITFTLISIGRCNYAGYQTKFTHQKCVIKNSTGRILLQAPKLYGLYCLDDELGKNQAYPCLSAIDIHKTLGHISHKALKHLLKHGVILGIELESIGDKITCNVCTKSKITRKPLPKEPGEHAKKLGEKVYSDIWGP